MHLTVVEFAVASVAVLLGSFVQGLTGFGVNLVSVPFIALVAPEMLPEGTILLSLPLAGAMAWQERHAVDARGVAGIALGRLPGTVAGILVVEAVSDQILGGLAGILVVGAVALSLLVRPSADPPVVAGAGGAAPGGAAGFMNTTASLDGPPLALLYQRHPAEVVRATLAVSFAIGSVVSLSALAARGETHSGEVVFALGMLPALGLGLLAARLVRHRLAGRSLRPAVLALAGVAGAVAIARAAL